jgi:two-component system, cell cycle response regulator DivK
MNSPSAGDNSDPLILIVEDDPGTRALFRDSLNQCGFRTIEAHNGFQALEKVQLSPPHAILTDLAVPGMDGFQFARALHQSEQTRDIPILAITGHSEYLDEPDRLRVAGIAQVLLKPCAPDVVARELRRLLRHRFAMTGETTEAPASQ